MPTERQEILCIDEGTECRCSCADDSLRVNIRGIYRNFRPKTLGEYCVGNDEEDRGSDKLGEHEKGHRNRDLGVLKHGLNGHERLEVGPR